MVKTRVNKHDILRGQTLKARKSILVQDIQRG
jgi:hypothetical protein